MAHIKFGNEFPGILGPLWYKSSSSAALGNLAHALLHGPSQLSMAERELIAAHVSKLNQCAFCHDSHAAVADNHIEQNSALKSKEHLLNSAKLSSLLAIAGKVQQNGKMVTPDDITAAKSAGASDEDIHDTVLIAAAFCMFNRYVDGLGTNPATPLQYKTMGKRLAQHGYRQPPKFVRWFVRKLIEKSLK